MLRTAVSLGKKGVNVGIVDLVVMGSQQNPDDWFRGILYEIERSLRLKTDSTAWWELHGHLIPTQRFMSFLEDVVLAECQGNVVIFFDEIDAALHLHFSDDFFSAIRLLYNNRAMNPRLRRLNFVLLGVKTTSALIQNHSLSPFNIGRLITLGDFDRDSMESFQNVLGDDDGKLVDRIYYWTSGHPWMAQRLAATAFSLPRERRTAEQIDEEVLHSYFRTNINQDTHFMFIQNYLLYSSPNIRQTLQIYKDILAGKKVAHDNQSDVQNRLKLSGLVRVDHDNLVPRNRIYETVFNRHWIREHSPSFNIINLAVYSFSFIVLCLLLWILIVQN